MRGYRGQHIAHQYSVPDIPYQRVVSKLLINYFRKQTYSYVSGTEINLSPCILGDPFMLNKSTVNRSVEYSYT